MRHSLHFKLLVSFMLVISITLGTVLLGISLFMKEQVLEGKQQELLQKGTELAQVIQGLQAQMNGLNQLDAYLTNADHYLDARIWVLDDAREIIAMSRGGHEGNMKMSKHGHMGMGMGMENMRGLFAELDGVYDGQVLLRTMEQPYYGERMVIVAVPIKRSDGVISGAVLLNAPVTIINAFMQRIYYYAAGGGLAALFLGVFVTSMMTKSIVKPLKAMEIAAGAMAKGDYSIRVEADKQDEVGRLGVAVNALAKDLSEYMEKIERTEKMRRDFVANVSHELRTPLTVLRGYTEALLDGMVDAPDQTDKYLRIMRDETVRLERLVKDLLDLSRLQSTTKAFSKEDIPLQAIAQSVMHLLGPTAKQKNIHMELTVKDFIPCIQGSGDHLTQLFVILLDNAIKYSPVGGKVTVTVAREPGWVNLTIQDEGIGIAAEDLPHVWERFYKADKSHSRTESGAGLGLAIAGQILERHFAQRQVLSQLGEGTTFIVRFPLT